MIRWVIVLVLVATAAVFLAFGALPAGAQTEDGIRSDRPMGFFGEGHAENHKYYLGLRNGNNGSCCNGKDGRPTQARWNGSTWDVMVNGEWRTMRADEAFKIITPEVFAKQGRERWDGQAHVFTSMNGQTIYCVIPPASGG